MKREQKQAIVEEIASELADAAAIFAIDYRGLSVPQAAELRVRLGEAEATFRVVKNRLAKRAAEGAGREQLDTVLDGPTALTLVKGDPVLAAKVIATFSREHGLLTYKGGFMEGAAVEPEQFQRIARLPGRDVLHGRLVGVVASPIAAVTRGLNQLIAGLASQLDQIHEKGLVGGGAEGPAGEGAGAGDGAGEGANDTEKED